MFTYRLCFFITHDRGKLKKNTRHYDKLAERGLAHAWGAGSAVTNICVH